MMKQMSVLSALILCALAATLLSAETSSRAEEITKALKNGEWAAADAMLESYMKDHPDQKWTYTSRSWALRNLKEFRKAADVAMKGIEKWPADLDLKKSAAQALGDLAAQLPPQEAVPLLERALAFHRYDYILHRLARAHRDLGHLETAASLFESGAREFPLYTHFSESLPYTRYLLFKETGKGKEARFAAQALEWLEPGKPLVAQQQYMMILSSCLRTLKDRKLLEDTYGSLAARFPEDPFLHDEYGFSLYATFRVHGESNAALLKEAVRLRKKAHDLYWKNGLPPPVKDLSHPLRGRNAVWSQFNGKAMTHNGFAAYCYDFATVDSEGRIQRPGSPGTKTADYYMFGRPVYAVADGTVSGIVAGFPDNSPSEYGNEANTITIEHSGFYSFYAHMKNGGILAAEKQQVKAGDLLGYAGNSGMSSQPHLHFCVYGKTEWVSIPFQFKKARVRTGNGQWTWTDRPYNEGETVDFE